MRCNLDSFYKPENIRMPSSCSFQPPVTFPLEKHVPAMSHSKHLPQGEVRLRYDVHKVICSSLHVNIFYVQFLKLLHKNVIHNIYHYQNTCTAEGAAAYEVARNGITKKESTISSS